MKLSDVLTMKTCPLCELSGADTYKAAPVGSLTAIVECVRCGRFEISDQAVEVLPQDKKYLLSSVCRRWPEKELPRILSTSIETFANRATSLAVAEQMDELLALMARKTVVLGNFTSFDPLKDYPLLTLRSRDEAEFLIDALVERRYVRGVPTNATVTIQGWERLEEIKKSRRDSVLVFVAMWFDPKISFLYDEAIRPAIHAAGYEPLRIDRHEHVNRIDDEIIGQIRRSRFMVADFTGQRLGVYFEAGLMMGLGRNVIWMCRADQLNENKLHFDVRQYNFIVWESPDDARDKLLHRIRAIEGEGPLLPKQP